MLTWIFTSYRAGLATFLTLPLLLAALLLTLSAAFGLGKAGRKQAGLSASPRERRLLAASLGASALAAMHLLLLAAGGLALDRTLPLERAWLPRLLLGPAGYDPLRLLAGLLALLLAGGGSAALAYAQLQDGGALRELANRLREPLRRREELGSAHFCYPGDFARLQKPKGDYELRLLGAFYGKRGPNDAAGKFYRLDRGPNRNNQWPWVALSAEDQARGMCLIGPPGTGKSQAGILPLSADAMRAGQSLVVLDPQNELLPYLLDYARVTGHRVAVHDPTDPSLPRFNLAGGLRSLGDAQAVARVLVPGAEGDFWSASARNLLAACLLRFENLGAVLRAFDDLEALAATLLATDDAAANAARAFAASVRAGDRSAPGVLATLQASTLGAWAEDAVQAATAASDFSAQDLVDAPTLLVLRCPGRYLKVYGPYLGACLQRLLLELDSLAEARPEGRLPRPLKVVIDEFPAMGRLEAVLEGVNLFRKRRISILLAAQTLAQFELVYGKTGAEALLAGLATQVYFGSCDAATARLVSAQLGQSTERLRQSGTRYDGSVFDPQLRQRELLSVEEVITPPLGNCVLVHRYATTSYAAQVVLLAALTYMFEREDWQQAIAQAQGRELQLLEQPLFQKRQLLARTATPMSDKAGLLVEDEY